MPLTLTQQITMANNRDIQKKVRQAVIVAAHAVLGDPGRSAEFPTRYAHIKHPDFWGDCMTPGVCAILGSEIPNDTNIQNAVNSIADRYRP